MKKQENTASGITNSLAVARNLRKGLTFLGRAAPVCGATGERTGEAGKEKAAGCPGTYSAAFAFSEGLALIAKKGVLKERGNN